MKKKIRLEKAWSRNPVLWGCKGIYFNIGKSIKHMLTPRQVMKKLKKEHIAIWGNNY